MKQARQARHLYPPFIVGGYWVMTDVPSMDQAARRLSDEHFSVFYCRRWLLGNLDPAPVTEQHEDFDFLYWLCDCDSNRLITPGAFMAALLMLGYEYCPTLRGIRVGCTAASVREASRLQTANKWRERRF